MKYKILIATLLLAILTIGAVNASEDNNMTSDTLTLEESSQDVISEEDERIEADYVYSHIPDEIYESDHPDIWVWFDSFDVSGSIAVQIDGVEVANQTARNDENSISYDEYAADLEYNKPYNLSLLYSGDSKYLPFNKTSQFSISYIKYDTFSDIDIDASQWASVNLPEDAEGKVSLFIDGKLYDTQNVEDGTAYFSMSGLTYGNHSYEFRYTGDKKYPKSGKKGTFEASYRLDFDLNDEDAYRWGTDVLVEIDTPGGISSKLTLDLNGIVREIELDEYGRSTYTIENLSYGNNTLIFTYEGDSAHPKRIVTKYITVIENIECADQIRYSSGDSLCIKLPKDAAGNVIVSEDDTVIANSPLENGEITIPISNLPLGSHELYINYTGNDYKIKYPSLYFTVIPYIVYNKSVSVNETNSISLILPEDGDGFFTVKRNDNILGNESIVNGKSSIDINNLKVGEFQEFSVICEGKYNYEYIILINVRDTSRQTPVIIHAGDKIVTSTESDISFEFNSFAQGYVNITVNNKTHKAEVLEGEARIYAADIIENLTLGKYTLEVSYSGDDYYNPSYNKTTFELSYINMHIPEKVKINQNDQIYVQIANDLTGEISLYINGKLYKKATADDMDNYRVIDLSELGFGEYKNVEIKFAGDSKYPKASKKGSFNVTYPIDIICSEAIYGYPAEISIEIHANLNGNCNVNVAGKDYSVKITEGHGKLMIDDLNIGEHNITVTYPGDSKFPKNSETETLTVKAAIQYLENFKITDENSINLTLPSDANGNLTVKIFDPEHENLYYINENVKLKDGFASIPVKNLKLGSYSIKAIYTGSDYDVDDVESGFVMKPFINEFAFEIDKDNRITFQMPSDAKGVLNVEITDWEDNSILSETVNLKNGIAVIALPDCPADYYCLSLAYSDEKYGSYEETCDFSVSKHTPSIKITVPKEIIAKDTTTIKFTVPKDATGAVWVSIGYDYFTGTVKNGAASVKIKPSKPGSNVLAYGFEEDENYCSWSNSTYVEILKTPTIKANDLKMYYYDGSYFKATVYDSFGKLVSGKYVDFYIGSKKIKSVKTDTKGIAKIKITQIPKTYKITVKYRGASITKKVTVKQTLTIKTVKVKKSAKKLVLTATLKKGKKALKSKKITFKFNGKKYTAKTNKKGIAKVTIKKSVLKKLKVGRKVAYQATYVKNTVKKTVKIKK